MFLLRYLQNVLPHFEHALISLLFPIFLQVFSSILFTPFETTFFITALSLFDFSSVLNRLSFSMLLFSPPSFIKPNILLFVTMK